MIPFLDCANEENEVRRNTCKKKKKERTNKNSKQKGEREKGKHFNYWPKYYCEISATENFSQKQK